MTYPLITIAMQVRGKGRRNVRITPCWAGEGLAVHKPVIIDGNDEPVFEDNCRNIWTLTHVHTGMRAGMFHGTLQKAIAFARQWDEAFAAVTSKMPQLLARNYREALCRAQDGPSEADMIEAGV